MNYNLDSAFLHGESIFITCKVVSGDIYDWDRHFIRLLDGVQKYFGYDEVKALNKEILESLKQAPLIDLSGALRVTVFKGADSSLKFNIATKPMQSFVKKDVVLKLVKRVQSGLLDEFKIGSYGKEFYLKRLAQKSGADDILFYGEGKIFETSVANIFFRKGTETFTPQSGIYKGITREKLIENHGVVERDIHLSEVDCFDEIYLGSSLYEKVNVKKIIKDI